MGFLKEKYNKEYFTGVDKEGRRLDYGALGADDWRQGGIFKEIKQQLDLVNLRGAVVLEIGYGRGESARYLLKERNVRRYIGVDFSEDAHQLAQETLAGLDSAQYSLEMGDALEFLRSRNFTEIFDAAFMLDSIEHIPAPEVKEMFPLIYRALKPGGCLIVDTPFYAVDEDYIGQGFSYKAPTFSDLHPATTGMHCNKFTRERLLKEMKDNGFMVVNDKMFRKPGVPLFKRAIHTIKKVFGVK